MTINRAWDQYHNDDASLYFVFFAWLSKFDVTPINARYRGAVLEFSAEQWFKDWWEQSMLRFVLMAVFWACFWPLWPFWYAFYSGADFYY